MLNALCKGNKVIIYQFYRHVTVSIMEMFLNLSDKFLIVGPCLLKGISWVRPALALLWFAIFVWTSLNLAINSDAASGSSASTVLAKLLQIWSKSSMYFNTAFDNSALAPLLATSDLISENNILSNYLQGISFGSVTSKSALRGRRIHNFYWIMMPSGFRRFGYLSFINQFSKK